MTGFVLHRRPGLSSGLLLCLVPGLCVLPARSLFAREPASRERAVGSAPAGSAATVSVVGLQFCSIDEPDEYEDWKITKFPAPPCAKLLLQVRPKEGMFIELDPDGSQVQAIEDDKGKDLKPKELSAQFFSSQIARDGKSALVVLEAAEMPSPNATTVHARARLRMLTASQKEKAKTPVVAIKRGTKLTAGKIALTISGIGKSLFSDKPSITFSQPTPSAAITQMAVIGPSGKKIKSSAGVRSRTVTPLGSMWTHEIVLDQAVEEASFEIEFWTDLQAVEIPVDVRSGIRFNAASRSAE